MSYILDALKKSERERELGKTPTIHSAPAALPVRKRSSLLIWLLGVALFLLSAAITFIYFSRAPLPEHKPEIASVVPNVLKPPATHVVEAPIKVAEPPGVEQASVPNTLTHVTPEEASQPKRKEPENAVSASSLVKAANPPPVKQVVEVSASVEKSDQLVAPLLEELPVAERAQVPQPPAVDVHVYSEIPAERFVLLNMKRYVEGQQTPDGFLVAEILEDGVLLEYRDVFFRIGNK